MFGRVILRCSEKYSSNATSASTYSTPTTLVLNTILNSENLWDLAHHIPYFSCENSKDVT